MENYITAIEDFWQIKDSLTVDTTNFKEAKQLVDQIIAELGDGKISVCEKSAGINRVGAL